MCRLADKAHLNIDAARFAAAFSQQRWFGKPLPPTLLVDFVLGAWSLLEVLDANFEGNTERMLDFFRAPSAFYADFDRLLRRRVVDAFPRQVHDEEREE